MLRTRVCRLIFTFIRWESRASNIHLCNEPRLLDFTLIHPVTVRTTRLLEFSEHNEPQTGNAQNYCLKGSAFHSCADRSLPARVA
jgi:hypothetical protein